jgi:hypothetical protein
VRSSMCIALMNVVGALACACVLTIGCRSPKAELSPSIEFTRVPPAGEGSADLFYPIEGRVKGARPGQEIVLFAQSGAWWVQPVGNQPFTAIHDDSSWKASTHPGRAYAALLVDPGYSPPLTSAILPERGGLVHAVAVAKGVKSDQVQVKTLTFSGYEWLVRQNPASPGGSRNRFDAANAWVDANERLHLRIAADAEGWTSAAVNLPRSLGYGSYRFVVSDISRLDPSVVLEIAAYDESGPNQEMNIEVSRWGELTHKNSQYVIQPFYIPANVIRFLSPAGRLTYSFDWEPGRVSFRTVRGLVGSGNSDPVAAHVFTSGVPAAGNENLRLQLYVYDRNRPIRLQHGVEVIIERFEFLP